MNKEQILNILKKIQIVKEIASKNKSRDKVILDKKFVIKLLKLLEKIINFLEKNKNIKK